MYNLYNYEDEKVFLECLIKAKRQGIHLEWLCTFFEDLITTQHIYESLAHANREWDL